MNEQAPIVTLVTPVYNQAPFVAQTIDSVLAQTQPQVEYIVIDDGSSDETPSVLARYAERIRTLRHDNLGQARTLNKGWSMARGRYLGYLSADDLLQPHALARMVERLDSDARIVCSFPDSDLIDEHGRVLRRNVCRPFDLEHVVVSQECHVGPGALFRRDAWAAIGGWRPELRLAPDRDFWMRLASQGRFHFEAESLGLYRTHAAATSFRAATLETSKEYIRVLDDFFAGSTIPEAIARRRGEAYAHATLVQARNALWRGEWHDAWQLYHAAVELHPPLRSLATRTALLRQGLSKPAKLLHARLSGLLGSRA
jgi:glycosyltransferase involved in cell wall biosynthesis